MDNIQLILSPAEAAQQTAIQKALASQLRVPLRSLCGFRIIKQSIDARQRQLKVLLTVQPFFSEEEKQLPPYPKPQYKDVHNAKHQVLIVGGGPAGLFAALTLLENGIRPVILERGKEVAQRKVDIASLNQNKGLDPESNYCFGEGGAGTFSDGKLFSRSKKRGNMQRVMEIFHSFGADDTVLYQAHPHIGTDILPRIIKNMRTTILQYGGEIHFQTKVTELLLQSSNLQQCVCGVRTDCGTTWNADAVILAIGHSAHDTYLMLHNQGVRLEPKGFALGVRVEHPQSLIDQLMYHRQTRGEYLPAASYALVTQVQNRGVYSFCMCPGGHIVPAGTGIGHCVVNGMSASKRNSPYANAGIVVEIRPEDLDSMNSFIDPDAPAELRGLSLQQNIEHLAYIHGEPPSKAPAQRLKDFVEGRPSHTLPNCSYLPGVVPSQINQWLPQFITYRLQQGFINFNMHYQGYLTNDAVILGVESRSSSAVRIPRNPLTHQHIEIANLYPCGEGAGYAGGITSSALDGINAALEIVHRSSHTPTTHINC